MIKTTKIIFIGLICLFMVGMVISRQDVELPDDMSKFSHVNTLAVPDAESPIHGIHQFYLNEKGMEVFTSDKEGKKYPDGTIFLGRVYKVVKTDDGWLKEGDLMAVTYMRKESDSEAVQNTGGWRFVMFTPDGSVKDIDPLKACFFCHKPHEKSDFVISTPLQK